MRMDVVDHNEISINILQCYVSCCAWASIDMSIWHPLSSAVCMATSAAVLSSLILFQGAGFLPCYKSLLWVYEKIYIQVDCLPFLNFTWVQQQSIDARAPGWVKLMLSHTSRCFWGGLSAFSNFHHETNGNIVWAFLKLKMIYAQTTQSNLICPPSKYKKLQQLTWGPKKWS